MLISLFFISLIIFLLWAIVYGIPYVPTRWNTAFKMIELLQIKPGDVFYDMGSGDGRMLILAARSGARAVGLEFNPYLVIWGTLRAILAGQKSRIQIKLANFWWTDLSPANKLVVYGMPRSMPRFAEKFKRELKPGTMIVSNSFKLPGFKMVKHALVGKDNIYLYKVTPL